MKVSIIGAGRVGVTLAYALLNRHVCREIVLVARDPSRAAGDVEDLNHAAAFGGGATTVVAGRYEDTRASDVVVYTASVPWEGRGTEREAATEENTKLFAATVPQLAELSPRSILLVVTNPVDTMTLVALRLSGFDPKRVIGTGTLVDTARFRRQLSDAWGINALDVRAYVLGEHGPSQFPALSSASAGGVHIGESDPLVHKAAADAKDAGLRVFQLKGYTNFGIATSCALIIDAIDQDAGAVLPISTLIDGYCGVRGLCLSVPAVVGAEGVRRALAVDLNEHEANLFRASAERVRSAVRRAEAALGRPLSGDA